MRNHLIDIERLKRDIPIEALIAQSFTVVGKGHTLTTAEHDSLKIFTRNNSWTWYSQAGRDGKNLGGSVIDWYMHMHQCSKGEAIHALSAIIDGGNLPFMPKPVKAIRSTPVEGWKSPQWQADAKRRLEAAQIRLYDTDDPAGEPGRAYLAERGIRYDMWVAFDLGYGEVWNIKAGRKMPAIWIPWQNRQVTAIQYRFLGVEKDDLNADRYGQLKGGARYLFGLQHCMEAEQGQLRTLFLVEGDLNAVSIFQCIFGQFAADVVSYGPQSNITNRDVAALAVKVASRYQYVIVWADEPETAKSALGMMPASVKVLPVRSPVIDGNKYDANYQLQQGKLAGIVYELIQKVAA